MIIVNKVTDEAYTQWIEKFAIDVLNRANIKYNEMIIEDIEPSRRVFVFVDGEEYTIRTWNYFVVECDDNDIPCAENIEYTLFKIVECEGGSCGEIVDEGRIKIKWINDMQ